MRENYYNEVFKLIKSTLVPNIEYEESKAEIGHLTSALENAKQNLREMESKYQEQKLYIEIIQAEKESLEAEKKTFEVKFNEVSLKLKLKNNQYNSLLTTEKAACKPKNPDQNTTGTQTVKEEPTEIGIVNFPASSKPTPRKGIKRTNSVSDHNEIQAVKRQKNAQTVYIPGKIRTQNKSKFTCEDCIEYWGMKVEKDFGGNPNMVGVPDPKQNISTFLSFEAYKNHKLYIHEDMEGDQHLCKEKSCLKNDSHSDPNNLDLNSAPHGAIICKICDLSFKYKRHHDQHVQAEHADMAMTTEQFYNLYLKFKDSYYDC